MSSKDTTKSGKQNEVRGKVSSGDTKSVKSWKSESNLLSPARKPDNASVKSLKADPGSRSLKSFDNRSIRSLHSNKSDTKISTTGLKREETKSVNSIPGPERNGGLLVEDDSFGGDGIPRGRKTRRDKNLIAMISLGYRYVYKTQRLQVDVKRCWDIVPKQRFERVDPYVKVYLMPDQSTAGKRKSQIVRNTRDPVFDKKLEYNIQKAELENRSLNISLWHNNLFGNNVFLGEVNIPLDSQLSMVRPKTYELRKENNLFGDDSEDEKDGDDFEPVKPVIAEYTNGVEKTADEANTATTLQPATTDVASAKVNHVGRRHSQKSVASTKSSSARIQKPRHNPLMVAVAYCGDVLLAIKFVPESSVLVVYDRDLNSRGEVFINIKKGMNLTGFGSRGETNAYCKLQIVQDGAVVLKHKTKVVKGDSNPEWNSCKRFENIGEENLRDVDIEIVVLNRIGLGTKMIGKSKITITGNTYDWTRAKFLSDNTLYLEELVNQANNWIEFVAPLKPHEEGFGTENRGVLNN